MVFKKESEFEDALIKLLSEKGWEKEVLNYYSEQDLLKTGRIFFLKIIGVLIDLTTSL